MILTDLNVLRLIVYLMGKFGISVVMTSLYLFTSELYPTEYRHSLLAFSSMIGRIGSISAPLTPALVSNPSLYFYFNAVEPSMRFALTRPEKYPTTLFKVKVHTVTIPYPKSSLH